MNKQWSSYQSNIYTWVDTGTGNGLVMATAGSGKTTTAVEALKYVKGSSIFLAFNKDIQKELESRGVNARTFHSLCYMPVLKARKARAVDQDKLKKIMYDIKNFSPENQEMYSAFAMKLVGLARQMGIGCLLEDTEQEWANLADHHDIELDHDQADFSTGIATARHLLSLSNKSEMVDFDDLLYFSVKDGISLPKFSFVFVDEAQDTNAIQRAIIKKIMRKEARLLAIGDEAQSIYGFRGSDSDSMRMIAEDFNCTHLPLSISYRCAQSIVNHARKFAGNIEAAPGAPEGSVVMANTKWDAQVFGPNDLVVCRTTKPLVELGYRMLREQRPFCILGRDIGKGLRVLITKMKAKGIEQLVEKLNAWCTREMEKAKAKGQEAKAESISDKVDSIMVLIEGLDENNRTIPELQRVIEGLFSDQARQNATTLSTIHKSKGLERDRVFWLNASKCPAQWAKKEWQRQQEVNLCFVATTRAKTSLVLIEDQEKN